MKHTLTRWVKHYKTLCLLGDGTGGSDRALPLLSRSACARVVYKAPRTVPTTGIRSVRSMTTVEATGNVGARMASQVRACVTDLQGGTRAQVAMAASSLRVLVDESSGMVRVLV